MKYTTENILTSLNISLADHLVDNGYAVLWDATKELQSPVGAPIDIVTFVPAFPADTRFLSRLKGESAGKEDILVPALTIYCPTSPLRVSTLGLGHVDSEWSRPFVVGAVAETDRQQRQLMDLLHSWLMDEPNKALPVFDYADPLNPTVLDPVYVEDATVLPEVIPQPFDAVRYLIRADASVYYFE